MRRSLIIIGLATGACLAVVCIAFLVSSDVRGLVLPTATVRIISVNEVPAPPVSTGTDDPDPALAQLSATAAGKLARGRQTEALSAYRELAARVPDDPVFQNIVQVLEKRSGDK